MYRRKTMRSSAAVLLLITAVRVLPGVCVDAAVETPELTRLSRMTLAMSVGAAQEAERETEPTVWVLHRLPKATEEEPPAAKAPERTPLTFSPGEAEQINVSGNGAEKADKAALLCAPLEMTPPTEEPCVLIVHTHTSEAYTQTAGWTYAESDPLRTTQSEYSVIRVGREIAEQLDKRGIVCLHDGSVNDYPDYNGAYARCGRRTEALLAEHPSVQVILDVHRDAREDAGGNQLGETVSTAEGDAAKVMLVVGTDEGGLEHPNWQKNLSLALKLQAAGMRKTPALYRQIDLRRERFNQQLSPGALLVEVGAAGNTLPEALTAARFFADALADVLLGEPNAD